MSHRKVDRLRLSFLRPFGWNLMRAASLNGFWRELLLGQDLQGSINTTLSTMPKKLVNSPETLIMF